MDVRAQILDQATRLFAGQGFDGTSVQEVADAVGIRKQSLLYHFSSKDALRQSVLDEMLQHWNHVMPALLLEAARDERFDAVMEALCSFFMADRDRARLIVREILDRPDSIKVMLADFVRPWIDVVADQLERAKAQSLVKEDVDPHAYAVHVISMIVSSIAVLDRIDILLPEEHRDSFHQRHVKELIRIARSSLYRDE